MGLGIRKPGYNIYVAGIQGTGRTSVIRSFLEKRSKSERTPNDWIYVYDFNDTKSPRAIELNPGEGRKFQKSIDQIVKRLREEIPQALQSEDYENAVNSYISASNERKSKLFSDLEKKAKSMDFQIKSTRVGIETVPVLDGRPLTDKEYSKLSDNQRADIETKRSKLEPQVLDFARKVRSIENETKSFVEELRNDLGKSIIGRHYDDLVDKHKDNEELSDYLEQVQEDILEHMLDFVDEEELDEEGAAPIRLDERDRFIRYRVNVFVDNSRAKGAPVIIEGNPTYYNLFGKVEKNIEHGTYASDFTMIYPGAVHKANGGYLVVEAADIFRNISIWETLKRVLKTQKGFIEDMGEQYSVLPTTGIRPQPIPLDVKIILIGNDETYRLLYDYDDGFHKTFKIKADFDSKMERNQANMESYFSFVATRNHVENLLGFDKSAVARIVEFGSRLTEDQRFLSTQFGEIKDLTIEADFIAREQDSKTVTRHHVDEAIDLKFHRLSLVEEQLLEMVETQDLLIEVEGHRVGQVNGLAVYDMGDFSFGKLSRITCTTSVTEDGLFNIDRASKLSGKIHDKGMYILSGFLNAILSREQALGFSASICFEQSYGIIDGDSASIAELVAILSSLAEIPISQSFAITGSMNQFGDVQPVGGINEKVEGFYKVCKLLGAKKSHSIIIPHQNVPNLMLHRDVRDAVKNGTLSIYPVSHAWQAFELATGVSLGIKSIFDKKFKPKSALNIIQEKLEKIHRDDHRESTEHEHDARKHAGAAKSLRI